MFPQTRGACPQLVGPSKEMETNACTKLSRRQIVSSAGPCAAARGFPVLWHLHQTLWPKRRRIVELRNFSFYVRDTLCELGAPMPSARG